MCESSTQEMVAEIEHALRKELEPFLHTALIPGGLMHETDRALIKEAMFHAVDSVLQKRVTTLQSIKDATTKENFGDPERNWLISECERLESRLARAMALASAVGELALELGTTIRNLRIGWDCDGSKNCEWEWHEPINAIAKRLGEVLDDAAGGGRLEPAAGTNKGRVAEFNGASEEDENVEPS